MKTKEIKIDEIYEELKTWSLEIITTDEISNKIVDYYNNKDGYYVSDGSEEGNKEFLTMKAIKNTNKIYLWSKDEYDKLPHTTESWDYELPVELNTTMKDEFEIALQFYVTYRTCLDNEIQDVYDGTPNDIGIIVWDGIDKTFEERANKILELNSIDNYLVITFDELVELMSKLKELQNNEYFKVINK